MHLDTWKNIQALHLLLMPCFLDRVRFWSVARAEMHFLWQVQKTNIELIALVQVLWVRSIAQHVIFKTGMEAREKMVAKLFFNQQSLCFYPTKIQTTWIDLKWTPELDNKILWSYERLLLLHTDLCRHHKSWNL